MFRAETNHVLTQLTQSEESATLGTWCADQISCVQESRIDKVMGNLSSKDEEEISAITRVCHFLMNKYTYPEVTFPNKIEKRLFAYAMAQAWLLTDLFIEGKNAGLISALALLLPAGRSLSFVEEYSGDASQLSVYSRLKAEFGGPHVLPPERFISFPELLKMEQLLFTDRRLFIHLALNGFVLPALIVPDQKSLHEDIRYPSIKTLSNIGLLNMEITLSDQLELLTLKELRLLAQSVGIEFPPKKKADIIFKLIAQIPNDILKRKFSEWLNDPLAPYNRSKITWLRFNVSNIRRLRVFLLEEYARLEVYLFTITFGLPDAERTIKKEKARFSSQQQESNNQQEEHTNTKNHHFENTEDRNLQIIASNSEQEIKIIDRYWNKECDQILEKLITDKPDTLPNEEVLAAVVKNFQQRGILESYQVDTANKYDEYNWRSVLNIYITAKIRKNAYYQLSSREMVCPGCGTKFLEWSVPLREALHVCMQVQFCSNCYNAIFYGYAQNSTSMTTLNDQELLNRLFHLGETLQNIPLRNIITWPKLPSVPAERQIAVGKAFLQMPTYSMYIERFGTWLNALVRAGLLNDGHLKTARGIQCLASDGHLCLSLPEKVIDDWLTSHAFVHEKEVRYDFDSEFNPSNRSRADWKVGNVYIEYAGLMEDPEYARKMKYKANLSEKKGFQLIIIEPKDLENLNACFEALPQMVKQFPAERKII
jgi:hypothetical protein